MRTDLVVVYSPVGGGHKAAAIATAEAARARGLSVALLDTFEHAPRWVGDAYVAAHVAGQSATPELYGQMYGAANRRGGLEPLRLGFDNLVFGALAEHVLDLAPRAVIATHHLPLVVLGRARRKERLDAPVVGVVTDYTAHACWAERGVDAWAVPRGEAGSELRGHGVAAHQIATTGIPVRSAFEHLAPLTDHDASRATRVLVTSGGFGVGPLARIVRSFAAVPNVELTVVCGNADTTRERVQDLAAHLGVPARVLGFERDMAARMAEAHVIIGKAGGLTVTEALTGGRPMIVVGAVPGNEKANEGYVTRGGAGVAATADNVGEALENLRESRLLASMGARARGLVPVRAADRVINVALALVRAGRLAA